MNIMHFENTQERLRFLKGEFKVIEPKKAVEAIKSDSENEGITEPQNEEKLSTDVQKPSEGITEGNDEPKKTKKSDRKGKKDEVQAE